MNGKIRTIIAVLTATLVGGCGEKNLYKHNTIRLTDDPKVEWLASFLGEDEVGYTSKIDGHPQSIYITQINDSKKRVIDFVDSIKGGDLVNINLIDDLSADVNGNMNNMRTLDGAIAVPVYFTNKDFQNKHGVAIINSDGSLINNKIYKIIFESEDFVFLEGNLNGNLYISTEPIGAKREYHTYEISIDGKINEINELPKPIKDKQKAVNELQAELYGALNTKNSMNIVYDFKTDEKGNITDVLVGWYKKDKFWKPKQWDLYILDYQDFKSKQKIPDKSSSLENKTNHLFAREQYDGTQKSQYAAYQQKANLPKPDYHRRM